MSPAVLVRAAGPSEGLPQFNPEFFSSQLFWLAVTFFGLYMFLSKVALPRPGVTTNLKMPVHRAAKPAHH